MKQAIILLLLSIVLVFSGKLVWAGHDNKHITFINQTNKKLKFDIDVPNGTDKHHTLHGHTANYENMGDACDKGPFTITVQHVLQGKGDKKVKTGIKRSCGDNLYIWHQDGEYKINDEPHVKADLSGCDKDNSKPAILFAHGLNNKQGVWKTFADHAKSKGWRVFRTSVSQDGSIAKRAHMLSAYISKAASQCEIPDRSLRVVTHSMGGLDIRYLVSKGLKGAKKIERIYTLATPHRGQGAAGTIAHTSDAVDDLGISQMAKFNIKHPYHSMKINGEQVHLMAIRFRCSEKLVYSNESDGVVKTFRQVFPGAPYSKKIYTGRHVSELCSDHIRLEQHKTDVLDLILKDHRNGNGAVIPYKYPTIFVENHLEHKTVKFRAVIDGAADIQSTPEDINHNKKGIIQLSNENKHSVKVRVVRPGKDDLTLEINDIKPRKDTVIVYYNDKSYKLRKISK